MNDSIFASIIRGDIPSHKIYEDDKTYAFLDIHPKQPGHTLVVPKVQVEFLWDLEDADYQAVMATCKKVANRLKEVLNSPFIGEQVVGVDVPHAHVHLIPFSVAQEMYGEPSLEGDPDHDTLAVLAKKLAF